ncbi:MAG: LptF/LptG family permease [Candidatus Hydrogenedentota bacterium]|nr:MAG: LptF/LptG family permease [Candidatus Hydrogenedentota bacterium]
MKSELTCRERRGAIRCNRVYTMNLRMKTFERHIWSSLWHSTAAILSLCVGVLLLHKMFRIVELAIARSLDLGKTLGLFLWTLPISLLYTVPLAALIATLFTYGRLFTDREIIALLAAGIPRRKWMRPALLFALLLACASLLNNGFLIPKAYRELDKVGFGVGIDPFQALQPGQFLRSRTRLFSVSTVDKEARTFRGFFAALPGGDIKRSARDRYFLVARNGQWKSDTSFVHLELEEGALYHFSSRKEPRTLLLSFDSYAVNLSLPHDVSPNAKRQPFSVLFSRYKKEDQIEILRRFGFAVVVVFFVIAAIPLAAPQSGGHLRKGTGSSAIGYGLLFYFFYWLLSFGSESLIVSRGLPITAGLLPYFVLGILDFLLWRYR